MSNSSTLDELPALSDDDVNVLYSIVSLASQSSDPPFRALFAAYDAVLADNGISTAHDQLYFRYLLRLGEGGPFAVDGGSARRGGLVARLRGLLERLDIHIVIGDGEEEEEGGHGDDGGVVTSVERDEEERVIDGLYAIGKGREGDERRGNGNRRTRTRRSSFNDTNLEETWVSGGRLDGDEVDPQRIRGANGARKPLPGDANPRGRHLSSASIAQRLAPRRHAAGQRARSLSTQGSLRISRPASRDRHAYAQGLDQDSTGAGTFSSGLGSSVSIPSSPPAPFRPAPKYAVPGTHRSASVQYPPARSSYQPPPPVYPPPTQAISPALQSQFHASADIFQNTTAYRTARRLLHRWHDQALRLNESRHNLRQIALNYDQQTLLSQAFTTWRANLHEKCQAVEEQRQAAEAQAEAERQAAETERFFDQLERRATRARDLFLLNKAFTHWAQCASDEVARTNVARRHILRVRYFNAWRDITAVNELKCRRLGLRKWFPVWRARAARKAVENERVLAIYEEKLVEKMYWKWFWSFCEVKAPLWKDARQKRSVFHKLAGDAGRHREMDVAAQDMRQTRLTRHAFAALAAKSHAASALLVVATRQDRTSLLSRTFSTLEKHSQLAPRWTQYEQVSSTRLSIKTIHIWSLNAALSRQAAEVDQQRLLRNATRDWNDSLRTKAITRMMDSRIKAEAWYKWILLERFNLFRRIADYSIMQRTLETLSIRLAEKRFRLGEAEAMFHQGQRRRLLMSVMLKMNRQSRNEEHMERRALEFRNSRLMRDVIPHWQEKHRHVQQLQRWSTDARFYCLTHTAIRRWKDATTAAKRLRRRDAYAAVRRRIKVNLVQTCFAHWRERSTTARQMTEQAEEQYRSRLVAIGTAAFDQWATLTTQYAEINIQSEDIYVHRLISMSISRLTAKGEQILQNHQEAEAYVAQTAHAATKSEMMRRMKWELFCLKRNNDSSEALKRRNEEQHRRNMLRYWAQGAMQRRAVKAAALADPDSPSKPEPSLFSSMRLPSARKSTMSFTPATARRSPLKRPATTGHSLSTEGVFDALQDATDEEEELDFGASTTARAEEWTGYDFLRGLPVPNTNQALPTLNEENEPVSNGKLQQQQQQQQSQNPTFATPLPGYLRTPSKRTARQRTRYKALNSAQRPASLPNVRSRMNMDEEPSLFDMNGEATDDEAAKPASAVDLLASTTPAPLRSGGLRDMGALTPQVTPFERKMRAGGFGNAASARARGGDVNGAATTTPASVFGKSRFGRGAFGPGTTARSVRFFDVDGDRGGSRDVGLHEKGS